MINVESYLPFLRTFFGEFGCSLSTTEYFAWRKRVCKTWLSSSDSYIWSEVTTHLTGMRSDETEKRSELRIIDYDDVRKKDRFFEENLFSGFMIYFCLFSWNEYKYLNNFFSYKFQIFNGKMQTGNKEIQKFDLWLKSSCDSYISICL